MTENYDKIISVVKGEFKLAKTMIAEGVPEEIAIQVAFSRIGEKLEDSLIDYKTVFEYKHKFGEWPQKLQRQNISSGDYVIKCPTESDIRTAMRGLSIIRD